MNSAKKIAETKEALGAHPVKMHFFLRNFQQKRIEGKTRQKRGLKAYQPTKAFPDLKTRKSYTG